MVRAPAVSAIASRLRQYLVITGSLTAMWIASDPITTNDRAKCTSRNENGNSA